MRRALIVHQRAEDSLQNRSRNARLAARLRLPVARVARTLAANPSANWNLDGGGDLMTDGPVEWVNKDAFVMPPLPSSLGIDPVVAALVHGVAFLELSGDGTVDPDWAVEAMEHIGFYLNQLSAKQSASLGEQLDRVAAHAEAAGWEKRAVEFFRSFMENFGIAEEDE